MQDPAMPLRGSCGRMDASGGNAMAIRVALVPVTDDAGDVLALDAALAVLRGSGGAHLRALHVRVQPSAAVFAGAPEGGMVTAEILQLWEQDARQRAQRARARYERWRDAAGLAEAAAPGAAGITASWQERDGQLDPAIGLLGRLADLVVLGAPADAVRDGAFYPCEGALFQSRRPVLLVPRAVPAGAFERILIGWNGSAEAAASVAGALPLLARAKAVTVLVAGEKGEAPQPPDDLIGYLGWHGIAATPRLVTAASHNVGAEMVREAENAGAGLIVMGAYTHSRVRELIFGGATNHVLSHATLPLLMAH